MVIGDESRKTKTWSERYGANHNKVRKDKYHSDPAYRETVKQRRRESYQKNKVPAPLVKYHKGVAYEVLRVGEAASAIGVPLSRLQDRVKAGHIPQSIFEGVHAYYTKDQVKAIKTFFAEIDAGIDREKAMNKLAKKWFPK